MIFLKNDTEYFCIYPIRMSDGSWSAGSRAILNCGKVRTVGSKSHCKSFKDARSKCKSRAKLKIKQGYVEVNIDSVPSEIVSKIPDHSNSISPNEMIEYMSEIDRERYVVFTDTCGTSGGFQEGIEYLAYKEPDGFLKVMDDFGNPRIVSHDRLKSCIRTEESEQLKKMRSS